MSFKTKYYVFELYDSCVHSLTIVKWKKVTDYCFFNFFIEIPVFPTVTATVTFQSFDWRENLDPNQFTIPFHYREDPKRFPDL